MSEQTLTYESVLDLIQKSTQEIHRTIDRVAEQQEKTAKQMKETDKKISDLGSRMGEIIENMVGGDNIINQFQKLGYNDLDDFCENKKFRNKKLGIKGEIDLFIENGVIAILVEVKTTLETADVRKHIQRLENFRRCVDAKGGDKRRFIGAVAGAVIKGDAAEVAIENGLYVIVQAGDSFKIVTPPEGFKAAEW